MTTSNKKLLANISEKYRLIEMLVDKLNNIGIALSVEKDISILLEKILTAAKDMTHAEGGTIYMFDKKNKTLKFEIMLNDVLKTHYGGSGDAKPPFPQLEIFKKDGSVNEHMVAAYSAGYKTKVNIEDAYEVKGFDFSGTKKFDQKTGYRSRSFLTIPMVDAKNELLGILQLINPRHENGEARSFTSFDEDMVESLTSQASIALSNRILLDEAKNLFEAMIGMINLALDEKSPYTTEHCQRVPIITMMLADAVCEHNTGTLKDFWLNEEEKNELRIAALLHDCGKIVTPSHVIDKSKKLELLVNRFEIILTRAEIVRKEMELQLRKNFSEKKYNEFLRKLQLLNSDLKFVKSCNSSSENLGSEEIERLNEIAKKWHYKDVTGKMRNLIDDHELKFLSISRGTLSKAEREIVNYHVVASIKMLKTLPWPENLKNVPEYAGGHHERIDGKGYPNHLMGKEMSVPAKIMAIADIFEALTAANRPYKPPVKLSESLKTMNNLSENGHLDPEIYKIFIKEKVYLKYAKEYMKQQQIDVD